jgi:putative FmdB family regulatory protein
MPTYSYLCGGCEQSFELEQRISEDPIKKCVLCGEAKARRQIVSGNFILKGGGWYSDGYGSSKKSTKAEASASNGGKADKPESATKSDKAESGSGKSDKAEGGSGKSDKAEGGSGKSDKAEGGSGKSDSSAAKGGDSKATAAE